VDRDHARADEFQAVEQADDLFRAACQVADGAGLVELAERLILRRVGGGEVADGE